MSDFSDSKKTLMDRKLLAGAAYNRFCPHGFQTSYRINAFTTFIEDYDTLPSFTTEHALSELKDVKAIVRRIDTEKRIDSLLEENRENVGTVLQLITTLNQEVEDHKRMTAELQKQIEIANQKLAESEEQHKRSIKTMRRRYMSSIALSVTLAAVGLAAKFGYFDGAKKSVEQFFFNAPHAKEQQGKIGFPKPLVPLSQIEPLAWVTRSRKEMGAKPIVFGR